MRYRYTFFIDSDLRDNLTAIKERDGISESEQIRRALKAWVEAKGIDAERPAKAPGRRRRASTGGRR